MFPLLHKDGLTLPAISLVILFLVVLRTLVNYWTDEPVLVLTKNIKLSTPVVSVLAAASVLGMAFLCTLHLGMLLSSMR